MKRNTQAHRISFNLSKVAIRTFFYGSAAVFITFWLWTQYLELNSWADGVRFSVKTTEEPKFPSLAPEEVKLAMRYHGIKDCLFIEDHGYIFFRNNKPYGLLDYQQFPKLKQFIANERVKQN
jgi:hypothetical protein